MNESNSKIEGSEQQSQISEEVKRFFNPDSIIHVFPENLGYMIETTLSDRRYIQGGQKLTLVLSPKLNIIEDINIKDEIAPEDYFPGYRVLNILTGNGEYLEQHENVYLCPPRSDKHDQDEDEYGFTRQDQMFFRQRYEIILAQKLHTTDHLASLIHEQGHRLANTDIQDDLLNELIEPANRRHKSRLMYIYGGKNSPPPDYPQPVKREQEILLQLLNDEKVADVQALLKIAETRKRGIDLFPNDPQLSTVKDLYRAAIATGIYPPMWDILSDQIDIIMNFD